MWYLNLSSKNRLQFNSENIWEPRFPGVQQACISQHREKIYLLTEFLCWVIVQKLRKKTFCLIVLFIYCLYMRVTRGRGGEGSFPHFQETLPWILNVSQRKCTYYWVSGDYSFFIYICTFSYFLSLYIFFKYLFAKTGSSTHTYSVFEYLWQIY